MKCEFYLVPYILLASILNMGVRSGAVGLGTVLQAGRSRVRFSMVSLDFFIDIILLAALCPWVDWASNRNEYQEYFVGGKGGR
jgi:hypothetical protein